MNAVAATDAVAPPAQRSASWKWAVCGLLLLATMLNYMDRITVAQLSKEIIYDFCLTEQDYGTIDAVFSIAFACGALLAGWMVDRWNVWWVYPTAVALWSLAGALTGFVPTGAFAGLLAVRFFLGLTEAGHWPCALRTTQRILPPEQRTLGNSILQSGAAIGSVLTPLVILLILRWTGDWRHPFVLIGDLGMIWVFLWYFLVRPSDLALATAPASTPGQASSVRDVFRDRRFWIMLVVVFCINSTWHFFRVWLPRLLQRTHGYGTSDVQFFTAAYYLSTDVGSLFAGFSTLWLARRGMSVHGSRLLIFCFCALLCTLSFVVIFLPRGPLLWIVMMVIGFAALGMFPPYYSFTQEISTRHQGKVTGMMGFWAWISMAPLRVLEGYVSDRTGSYVFGLTLAGLTPLVGAAALLFFWPSEKGPNEKTT